MKNPLIDVAAILTCLIAVIVGGQYFINQKEARENRVRNVSAAELEKGVKLEVGKPIRITFESASKVTE
jgi:hypothetical protein